MVVAAGTGGHVMPGLAVAEALRARGWSVSWLGTRVGMERQLVEPRGIAFDAIDFAGLRGKGVRTLLLGGFYLLRALWQSRALIRARKPRVMFSTGGYVAVPAGMAASTLGVPLVLLNSDAALLMSTKMLKSLASAVLCGFDGAAAKAAGDKGSVTGNPVRVEIAQIAPPEQRYAGRSGPLQLLVIGGSLGAQVLNESVPRALALVSSDQRPQGRSSVRLQAHRFCAGALSRRSVSTPKSSHSSTTCRIATRRQISSFAARARLRCRSSQQPEWQACWFRLWCRPLRISAQTLNSWQRMTPRFTCRRPSSNAPKLAELLRTLTRDRLLAMAEAARSVGRPESYTVGGFSHREGGSVSLGSSLAHVRAAGSRAVSHEARR